MRESNVFQSNFRSRDFDGFRRFEVFCFRKSHLQQLVSMFVYVCYPHNSKTNCSRIFKYSVSHLFLLLEERSTLPPNSKTFQLESFIEDRVIIRGCKIELPSKSPDLNPTDLTVMNVVDTLYLPLILWW